MSEGWAHVPASLLGVALVVGALACSGAVPLGPEGQPSFVDLEVPEDEELGVERTWVGPVRDDDPKLIDELREHAAILRDVGGLWTTDLARVRDALAFVLDNDNLAWHRGEASGDMLPSLSWRADPVFAQAADELLEGVVWAEVPDDRSRFLLSVVQFNNSARGDLRAQRERWNEVFDQWFAANSEYPSWHWATNGDMRLIESGLVAGAYDPEVADGFDSYVRRCCGCSVLIKAVCVEEHGAHEMCDGDFGADGERDDTRCRSAGWGLDGSPLWTKPAAGDRLTALHNLVDELGAAGVDVPPVVREEYERWVSEEAAVEHEAMLQSCVSWWDSGCDLGDEDWCETLEDLVGQLSSRMGALSLPDYCSLVFDAVERGQTPINYQGQLRYLPAPVDGPNRDGLWDRVFSGRCSDSSVLDGRHTVFLDGWVCAMGGQECAGVICEPATDVNHPITVDSSYAGRLEQLRADLRSACDEAVCWRLDGAATPACKDAFGEIAELLGPVDEVSFCEGELDEELRLGDLVRVGRTFLESLDVSKAMEDLLSLRE